METHQSMFVDRYYEMDPQTDDLLLDGQLLEPGMIVLIENIYLREDITLMSEEKKNRALETNRWALVSNLEKHGDSLSFVAIYEDGSKRNRKYKLDHGWLVKKETVPVKTNETRSRRY